MKKKSYFPQIRKCIGSHGFCSEKVNINVFMHFAMHSIASYASDFPRELSLSWGVDVAINAQRSGRKGIFNTHQHTISI